MPVADSLQTVFFDLGFTLINFEGDFHQVTEESYLTLAESLRQVGCPIQTQDFADRFKHAISDYYRSRDEDLIERPIEQFLMQVLESYEFNNLPQEFIQQALTNMYRITETHWQLETDTLPVLDELQNKGYRLGLISNAANADNANRLIDQFELRRYFEVILISAIEKIRKPDTRIYSRAMAKMELPPASAVMVGDTLTADILGAQNAGLRAIWIRRRALRPENELVIGKITPDAVIDSLAELPAVLRAFPH